MLASQILAVYKQKARFATSTGEYKKRSALGTGEGVRCYPGPTTTPRSTCYHQRRIHPETLAATKGTTTTQEALAITKAVLTKAKGRIPY
jgi:hypothetical protein